MSLDRATSARGKTLSGRLGRDVVKILAVSAFFVGIALLLQNDALRARILDAPLLRNLLETAEAPGHIYRQASLFVLTFSLLIGLGMPRLWVSAISGAAFGPLWGTLLALVASVAGAAIVYRFGRTLLAGILQRRIRSRLSLWQTRFEHNAFWWVLYMRLFPLSNATLAGLVCGACRIPLGAYLAGSLIGFIPLTVVFAVFGSGGAKGDFYQVALGTLLLLLAVGDRKRLAPVFRPPESRGSSDHPSDVTPPEENHGAPHPVTNKTGLSNPLTHVRCPTSSATAKNEEQWQNPQSTKPHQIGPTSRPSNAFPHRRSPPSTLPASAPIAGAIVASSTAS